MISPPLYTLRKIPLSYILEKNFQLCLKKEEQEKFMIRQQDNLLFRQIRLITKEESTYNPYVIFISTGHSKKEKEALSTLVFNGITINGTHFLCSERSASMVRSGILSFVAASVFKQLNKRITMGISFEKTVLSKYYAYRGLMLSACHCLNDWYPKIIIVADFHQVVPKQNIKYVYDRETEYEDAHGNLKIWQQKDITKGVKDISINAFDGCGIHHPEISQKAQSLLKTAYPLTSILWRAPFIKGMTHQMDYVSFFKSHGITHIRDLWGVDHPIDQEPMIIMSESMFKGKPYFQKHADQRDWNQYWAQFHQHQHCLGIAKWNFSKAEEAVYTRANYQILQDLDLPYEDFAKLAKYSIDWISKIIQGDPLYTLCFLGMVSNNQIGISDYAKAIMKNPHMLKEQGVRSYLISLIEKYKDEMKCGKLWIKSCFKILAPDLILFMQWIGNLPQKYGALQENEFYATREQGVYDGEFLIERNPHICKSEHAILQAANNRLLQAYCSHLDNVCMINSKSITPQRLNGADFDGDLVLLVDDDLMKQGVQRDAWVVIDVQDKATAISQKDTPENKLKLILRTMHSLIGETSNCATAYHNKTPSTALQKEKQESYIDLLSVINGKSIDYAKTGVLFQIPRHIAKYGRPLPYFMKYAGPYYSKQHKFLKSHSNMNRLCFDMEKWEKSLRYQRNYKDFDYRVMMDDAIPLRKGVFLQIQRIYLDFAGQMATLAKDQVSIRAEHPGFILNWQHYYSHYQTLCSRICPNKKELANIAVTLCYETYPKASKKFLWRVAGEGVLENIKQVPVSLPKKDPTGSDEYLGKAYRFTSVTSITSVALED